MYTIILKPKYIRNIRDYNKKAKNQGKDSYSDFTVTSSSYGSSYNEYLGYQKGDFPIAEMYADTVLSLPLYAGMTDEEQSYVIQKLNNF